METASARQWSCSGATVTTTINHNHEKKPKKAATWPTPAVQQQKQHVRRGRLQLHAQFSTKYVLFGCHMSDKKTISGGLLGKSSGNRSSALNIPSSLSAQNS
jgi:hypothetical protein